jgi:sugar phosphate permease
MERTRPARAADTAAGLTSTRWRRLMPIAFVTYSLAYLDRSNYSIGVAGGLKHDLGIGAGDASLLGALFFAGYFLFQIPAAHYAEHRSVRRLVFWCVLAWGMFASAQGLIPWLWLLMVDRFALGVVEAAIIPAMLILLLHWFTAPERGRANTVLILGNPVTVMWLSAISGYLIQATNWRVMFIVEGVPAILWAFVFRFTVHDRPAEAAWLDQREKDALAGRLDDEQRRLPSISGYADAFRTRNVVLLTVQYMLWSVGVYGFVFWLPTILEQASNHGIGFTGALTAVPYFLGAVLMLVTSTLSDRSGHRRGYTFWTLLVSAVALSASFAVGSGAYWTSYALLIVAGGFMYAPYGPFFAWIPEFLPRNVSGAAMALVNSGGAVGGFAGAYVVGWLSGGIGTGAALAFMAAAMFAAALILLLVRTGATANDAYPADDRAASVAAARGHA